MSEKEAKILSSSIPGAERPRTFFLVILHLCMTVSGPWGYPQPWLTLPSPPGVPPPCLQPRTPFQPLRMLVPAPVLLEQGWSPAPHNPAWPWAPELGPPLSPCPHPQGGAQCPGLGPPWVPWCHPGSPVLGSVLPPPTGTTQHPSPRELPAAPGPCGVLSVGLLWLEFSQHLSEGFFRVLSQIHEYIWAD